MPDVDVLVVGAGPAGSCAASEAAKAGCRVLMVEKRKKIGVPVQCAEYVPRLLMAEAGVSDGAIVQGIDSMVTYLPDGTNVITISPGFIIDRGVFDSELAALAEEAGAEVRVETVCLSKSGANVVLKCCEDETAVTPQVIIGADGPISTVGEWMGSVNKDFIMGAQHTIPLTEPLDSTEVYFMKDLFCGYGWLFPKGGVANVGVGVKRRPDGESALVLLEHLVSHLEKNGKISGEPIASTGGLIPVGGPLETVKNNMMLVGDAAGHTDSITGGGVPQAVICGKMAGKAAARAVIKDDLGQLAGYEGEWRRLYGGVLQNALEKRRILESSWNDLDEAIRKCWVAFGGYYND